MKLNVDSIYRTLRRIGNVRSENIIINLSSKDTGAEPDWPAINPEKPEHHALRGFLNHLSILHVIRSPISKRKYLMLKKRPCLILLSFMLLAIFSAVQAAELRGRLTGIAGAILNVQCPGGSGSASLNPDGSYVVTGLPAGKSCSFTVSSGNQRSVAVPFSTSRSVTIYNGELKQHQGRILGTA